MDDTDRMLQMKAQLATPGLLTPQQWRETRTEYVQYLQHLAWKNNTGHAVIPGG